MTKTIWQEPKENYSRLPHQFIEEVLPKITSLSEMKVIVYVLRHTWGYHEDAKSITIDEFTHGRKRKDGTRLDAGTGMSENAIKAGIKSAVKHGFLFMLTDDSDKARIKKTYSLSEFEGQELMAEGQELTPGVPNVDPRSEKDTLERNSKKEKEPLSSNDDSGISCEQSEADLTKERYKAINELIKAWIDSLPSKPLDETNPYKKKGYRDHASNMVDAGITAQDIERFVKAVTAQGQFFADKKLPFGKVTSDIAAWLQKHPSENKPDKSLDYAAIGLTPPEQQVELTIEEFERRQDEMQALKDKLSQAWGVNRDRKISRISSHA